MKRTSIQMRSLKTLGLGLVRALVVALTLVIGAAFFEEDLTNDLVSGLYWTGIFSGFIAMFSLAGWLTVVLPLTFIPDINNLLNHPVAAELIWMLLAVASFALVVATWAGPQALFMAWIPATIGLLAGNAYRKLNRKDKVT